MNISAPRLTLTMLCATALLTGCTERRIFITSTPPDAQVYLNDVDVGRTPLEVDFTYFGIYDIRVRKYGFEPLITSREAEAPFHEWPVVDLVAMAIPARKTTHIRWHFDLAPESEDIQGVIDRGRELGKQLEKAPLAPIEPPEPSPALSPE